MELIKRYFPELSDKQLNRLQELNELYRYWNARINVISRKDIDNLMLHHVLHSLAIARVFRFIPGTSIMDIGTGGGFPGIPLAIMFPQCRFTLVDSITKKIRVATEIAETLGLQNVTPVAARAESITEQYDFIVSRAVAPIPKLMGWIEKNIKPGGANPYANGLICLKGGDLTEELKPYRKWAEKWPVQEFFAEKFFAEKYIVYIPL